ACKAPGLSQGGAKGVSASLRVARPTRNGSAGGAADSAHWSATAHPFGDEPDQRIVLRAVPAFDSQRPASRKVARGALRGVSLQATWPTPNPRTDHLPQAPSAAPEALP